MLFKKDARETYFHRLTSVVVFKYTMTKPLANPRRTRLIASPIRSKSIGLDIGLFVRAFLSSMK